MIERNPKPAILGLIERFPELQDAPGTTLESFDLLALYAWSRDQSEAVQTIVKLVMGLGHGEFEVQAVSTYPTSIMEAVMEWISEFPAVRHVVSMYSPAYERLYDLLPINAQRQIYRFIGELTLWSAVKSLVLEHERELLHPEMIRLRFLDAEQCRSCLTPNVLETLVPGEFQSVERGVGEKLVEWGYAERLT